MKTDLSHLPGHKRSDIEGIADFMCAQPGIDPEMIVLFGSYARGDWAEDYTYDGPIMYSYISDYDILVVVETVRSAAMFHRWRDLEDKLRRIMPLNGPSVNLIVHDVGFLNARLGEGRYFFKDIREEGVLLYDSGRFTLAEARDLIPEEQRRIAQEEYDIWFPSAVGFYGQFEHAVDNSQLNIAAFELHQATERFYGAFLLVQTGYKPKYHDIEKLGKLAASEERRMLRVFPRGTAEEKERFELLRRAYVDARYSKTYTITREELEYLAGRVRELRAVVDNSCRRKIKGLERA